MTFSELQFFPEVKVLPGVDMSSTHQNLKSWVPLGTRYRGNFRSWLPLGTGNRGNFKKRGPRKV